MQSGPSTSLEGLDSDDVLLVQHAGAYLEAIVNRFNCRRSVEMVALEGAQPACHDTRRSLSRATASDL